MLAGFRSRLDDALIMRRFERAGNLTSNQYRLVERNRALGDSIGKRLALDQLEDERLTGAGILDAMNVRDVWMIQRGEHLRLALEPRDPVGVGGKCFR